MFVHFVAIQGSIAVRIDALDQTVSDVVEELGDGSFGVSDAGDISGGEQHVLVAPLVLLTVTRLPLVSSAKRLVQCPITTAFRFLKDCPLI